MKRVMQRRLTWDIGFIAILYTLISTAIKPQTPAVFLLMILSLNMLVARLRFKRLMRWLMVDIALFFAVSLVFPPAFYLAAPAAYLISREGRFSQWAFIVPLIVVTDYSDPVLWGLFALAGLSGTLIFIWQDEKSALLSTVDRHKKKLFEIQNERASLLDSQSEISRIATYSERDRIAQKLHDDLGHEITAGLLSLKAHKRLNEQEKDSETVLDTAIARIENAATELKHTVHNTKPLTGYGLDVFKQEIGRFPSSVDFDKQGDISRIGPHHWQVLNAVLKESLTNALKHAEQSPVKVTLEVTAQVVRLSIENENPNPSSKNAKGYGLSFMRSRIEALGGSLSLQRGMTFKVIAILPLKEETHEHTAGR